MMLYPEQPYGIGALKIFIANAPKQHWNTIIYYSV